MLVSSSEARRMTNQNNELQIASEADIVSTRKVVRDAATSLGFSLSDVTRIVTAASELSRNIYQYAGSGVMRVRILQENSRKGIELVFEDHGPGIPDIEQAMQPGFTTGKGMGLGLAGSKRLMDELTIESKVGQGTTIRTRKWRSDSL